MLKDLSISMLLDFYGEMLTQKQREVIELYYNEDLSLSEIAAHSNITRQGVRDSIKRAEVQLRDYEARLGLAVRFMQIKDNLGDILTAARDIDYINEKCNGPNEIYRKTALIVEKSKALAE